MTYRVVAVFALLFAFSAAPALAASGVQPSPNRLLSGKIKFPRAQSMSVQTGRVDATVLTVTLGFDGQCRGGGLGEVWAAYIPVASTVRVRNGKFAADPSASSANFGGVTGRTAVFRWHFEGSFSDPTTVTASVSGRAEVRSGGKVISRCEIAKPATVKLTQGG